MIQTWRLLQSGNNDAATNMAIDEAILLNYGQSVFLPTLRIYGWSPAAFSLGCFQDVRQTLDLTKCEEENITFVRRITGGGAIYHNQELTYSLVCSLDQVKASGSVLHSFKVICSFLLFLYKNLGLEAGFAIESKPDYFNNKKIVESAPFCFAVKEKYDILIGNRKIGGNAQKRRKRIIFQQGSIPLKSNIDKATALLIKRPESLHENVCSLEEVLGREIGFQELESLLIDSFKKTFAFELVKDGLTEDEIELAERLKQEKYSKREWNFNGASIDFCQKAAVAE